MARTADGRLELPLTGGTREPDLFAGDDANRLDWTGDTLIAATPGELADAIQAARRGNAR